MIRFLIALASAAALLLVSTYDLLASIPFAYQQFIESPPFWWMPILARLQPILLVAALGGLRFAIGPLDHAGRRGFRLLTIAAVTLALGIALPIVVPPIASYRLSAALCFAPLVVLAWASAIRLAGSSPAGSPPMPAGTLAAAAVAGLTATTAFAVNAAIAEPGVGALQTREVLIGSAAALVAHVLFFAAAWIAVRTAHSLAARRWSAPVAAGAAVAIVSIAILGLLFDRCVLSSLMVDTGFAVSVSIAFASGVVLFWMAFVPALPRWTSWTAAPVAIVLCVLALPPLLRFADWASSVHKLLAMAAWLAAFRLAAAASRSGRALAALGLAALVAWTGTIATIAHGASTTSGVRPIDASLALERYATVDIGWRALLDVGRPMVSDGAFLSALREVGDVTYNRSLPAVPLRLADDMRVPRPVPHVFIVVIDSLRPDYVSAYNPRVSYTPAIGAFARDSIVLRNAYTAYSGTGLSEAALWAGGLVQRTMYVKPFAAIDNLERLTVAAGYRRYISIDEVMDRILEDQTELVRLDADIIHEGRENDAYKLDLCRTVGELTRTLDARRSEQPIFFYTQPKNLHIRVIAGDTPNYATLRGRDEFFRPAAETIGRLDGCFGRFIDYLKAKQLYDDSIIVLTADHGDAYGEEGRWGHAFYVTPETLRIPIIMHVPERMRPPASFDPNRVAWLTDLTPTLYALLGVPPRDVAGITGHPLFEPASPLVPRAAPDMLLVQSSYSRIFGLMDRDARRLYTADANRLSEELFDLTAVPPARMPLGEADRLQYHQWLLERVRHLNDFYAR